VTIHWLSGGHSLSRDETDLAREWIAARFAAADTAQDEPPRT
jgi:predicted esterase